MWVVLVAALVICWMARVRIQASEEIRSAEAALAGWGWSIEPVFHGVIYPAYLASSVLAVSSQARQASEHFLQRLGGERYLAGAFLLTLKPSCPDHLGGRATSARSSEVQYNVPGQSEQGAFTKFCQSDLARLLQLGGKETTLKVERFHSAYDKGEYRVTMRYVLTAPPGDYEAVVTAVGLEAPDSRGPRQWYIDANFTAVVDPGRNTGQRRRQARSDAANRVASEFADRWTTKLRLGAQRGSTVRWTPPTSDTVAPGAAREAAKGCPAALFAGSGGSGRPCPAGACAGNAGRPGLSRRAGSLRPGRPPGQEGILGQQQNRGRANPPRRHARGGGPDFRRHAGGCPHDGSRDRIRYLLSTTRDGRTLLGVPYRVLLLPTPDGKPNFRLRGRGRRRGRSPPGPRPRRALRIHSLRLLRGQSAPAGSRSGRQRR